MTDLTPQEALQAIADGKKLEYRWYSDDEWYMFYPSNTGLYLEHVIKGKNVFRLAQEMITIGDVSFPKPESEPLTDGTEYWVVTLDYIHCTRAYPSVWNNSTYDLNYLRKGLVHLSVNNARLHGEALIKLSGGNVDG